VCEKINLLLTVFKFGDIIMMSEATWCATYKSFIPKFLF